MAQARGKDMKMITIITDLNEIKEAQTREIPKSDDVWLAFPEFTKGFVVANYSSSAERFVYGYCTSLEEAVEHCKLLKTMNEMFGNKNDEMYLFSATGQNSTNHHTRWALYGAIQ